MPPAAPSTPGGRWSEPTWTPRAMRRWPRPNPPCSGSTTQKHRLRCPSLVGAVDADLVVVGGGYTGLWTALQAKEADPGRDVVLVEAATLGWAASGGRNGGFCTSSLTHGEANGLDRFPGEFDTLERLGRENLDGIEATITRHGIDAEFERGELDIAVEDWHVAELTEFARLLAEHGTEPVLLDREQTQALVHSPTYLASRYDADGVAVVHPAKLAWGLRQACLDLGVRIYEHTEVTRITSNGAGLALRCPFGSIRDGR